MSCREPKLSALLAEAQGRLSAQGLRRWQAHCARCPVCSDAEARRAVCVLQRLTETARQDPVPAPEWERVRERWSAEARSTGAPKSSGRRAGPVALVLAAAAVLIGVLAWRSAGPAEPVASRSVRARVGVPAAVVADAPASSASNAREAEPAPLTGARWTLAGMERPPAERPLHEGEVLQTGPREALHVQLEPGTGFVLEADSRLRLARLRQGQVVLELIAGAVTSRVRELGAAEHYGVRAGTAAVWVRGTRFRVALGPQGVEVTIDDGAVEIEQAGEPATRLVAPGRWPADGSTSGIELADPHGYQAEVGAWPLLRATGLRHVEQLRVGSTPVQPADGLAMRVPPGDVDLHARLRDGRTIDTRLRAEAGALDVDLDRLPLRAAPARAKAPGRAPPTAALTHVLHRSAPALRRCYERTLLLHPALGGRLSLRVRLDGAGAVADTEIRGDAPVPQELSACLAQVTRRWQFPGLEAGVELEAPLDLSPSAQ